MSIIFEAQSKPDLLPILAAELVAAEQGNRNKELFRKARVALESGYEVGEIRDVLGPAGQASGLLKSEVKRTLDSALYQKTHSDPVESIPASDWPSIWTRTWPRIAGARWTEPDDNGTRGKRPIQRWQYPWGEANDPVKPSDFVALALPPGTILLDIDNFDAFMATEHPLPEGLKWTKSVSGRGPHMFFRLHAERPYPVARTGAFPGADTKVGGTGISYEASAEVVAELGNPKTWPMAPDWLQPAEAAPSASVDAAPAGGRNLRLTPATEFTPRRVRWLWDQRLAMGSISLIGGREGQGKTLLSLELAALVTRGALEGEVHGQPRNVIVVTTEDAWDETILPRLMAAGADLARVFRVDVVAADDVFSGLSLPKDFRQLEQLIYESEAVLVVLDPLMSRLDASLDTHKDAEVRQALEPLVALAGRTKVHVTGLIHVNKTVTTDPLTSIMASRAFVAVARAVLFVMKDPEDGNVRLVGQPKNNLGRTDMDTMRFEVDSIVVGSDPDDAKPITAPKIRWVDSTTRSVEDALVFVAQGPRNMSKRAQAGEWLIRFLQEQRDGRALAGDVVAAARRAGHGEDPLRRAREALMKTEDVFVESEGFPKQTYWQLSARHLVGSA